MLRVSGVASPVARAGLAGNLTLRDEQAPISRYRCGSLRVCPELLLVSYTTLAVGTGVLWFAGYTRSLDLGSSCQEFLAAPSSL